MGYIIVIINLNAFIQHIGKLFLDGQEIGCIALDRTCTFKQIGVADIELTDSQLEDLCRQATG